MTRNGWIVGDIIFIVLNLMCMGANLNKYCHTGAVFNGYIAIFNFVVAVILLIRLIEKIQEA
jgi:hypothetical protein